MISDRLMQIHAQLFVIFSGAASRLFVVVIVETLFVQSAVLFKYVIMFFGPLNVLLEDPLTLVFFMELSVDGRDFIVCRKKYPW